MKLYAYLAHQLSRIDYLRKNNRDEYAREICEQVTAFVKENFPSGSGFDNGTHLNLDKSTSERLVFRTEFHHMNDAGTYDGWTQHEVIVKPSLQFGIDARITGRNRRDIKDYIAETFGYILGRDEDFKFLS